MSCFHEDDVIQCGGWNEVANEKRPCDYWMHNKIEYC